MAVLSLLSPCVARFRLDKDRDQVNQLTKFQQILQYSPSGYVNKSLIFLRWLTL